MQLRQLDGTLPNLRRRIIRSYMNKTPSLLQM